MAETVLVIGSDTRCIGDKVPGEVKSVVVNPSTRTVTHLVVEPKGRVGLARLVPLDDKVEVAPGKIGLHYTEAVFEDLPAAEETVAEILPGGPVELVPEGWRPAGNEPPLDGSKTPPVREGIAERTSDLVPAGEEEEHRGDHVHATDGDIGQLRALGIDSSSHRVTHVHVLLKEGHLRRHREVAIPSDKVSGFDAGIHLNISKQEVRDLAHDGADHPSA